MMMISNETAFSVTDSLLVINLKEETQIKSRHDGIVFLLIN